MMQMFRKNPKVQAETNFTSGTSFSGTMKIVKFPKRAAVVVALAVLYILYSPNLLDFNASGLQTCYMEYDGPLTFNKALERSEFIGNGELPQPEALEYKDGKLYAALSDGRIVILENDRVAGTLVNVTDATKKVSRPLGLRFFKDDLYVVDGILGLLKVDMKTGGVTILLPTGQSVRGTKLLLPDDLDIDAQGVIYFSDLTSKWHLHQVMYGIIEKPNDGRIIAFDTKTGKYDVLLDNLNGPNGVQLTYDKSALLISETWGRRVIKYHLRGPRKGMKDIFCNLPGEPDNLRPSSRGGYWVALPFSSSAANPHPIDYWTANTKIRNIFARLCHMTATGLSFLNSVVSLPIFQHWEAQLRSGTHILNWLYLQRPTVIEVDAEGNIIRSLQSDNPKFSLLTHPFEKDGNLYLGTFVHNYIVKVKL